MPDKKNDNPLARLEPPKMNIPLLIAGVLLFVLAAVGGILSVRDEDLASVAIFSLIAFVFLIVVLLYQAQKRRNAAVDDRKFIRWNAAIPELQRQNVNLEVHELARLLGVGGDSLTDLLTAYIVAEDLALRQIQQEENLPLMRHVNIGGAAFDGILVERDLITCIEVSFLVTPDVRQEKIESMLKKVTLAKKNLAEARSRLRLRLMLVLVTQMTQDEEEQLRGMLITRRFTDTPVDIDIRMLDFEMLQKVYVSE